VIENIDKLPKAGNKWIWGGREAQVKEPTEESLCSKARLLKKG
jgi:hypothetical protein